MTEQEQTREAIMEYYYGFKKQLKDSLISKDEFYTKTIGIAWRLVMEDAGPEEILRMIAVIDTDFYAGPFQDIAADNWMFELSARNLANWLVKNGHVGTDPDIAVESSGGAN